MRFALHFQENMYVLCIKELAAETLTKMMPCKQRHKCQSQHRHKHANKHVKSGSWSNYCWSNYWLFCYRDATPQKTHFKRMDQLRGIVSAAQIKTKQIAAKLPCLMRSLAWSFAQTWVLKEKFMFALFRDKLWMTRKLTLDDAWHPHTALTSRSSWVSHCKASLDGCRSSKLLKHCSTWMHMEHLGSMPNDHFVEKRPAEIWWKSDFGQDIFEKTSDLVTLFP